MIDLSLAAVFSMPDLAPADSGHDQQLVADAKRALRRLASSVSVVTCRCDGRHHAMTATSVNALSMDPPSMLVCVNRAAGFHRAINRAGDFAINVLGRAQVGISRLCSGGASGEDRFAHGAWDTGAAAPVLVDAQAAILCRKDKTLDYGTHTIFMGRILSIAMNGEIDPLIYVDGQYTGRVA
ncbi:MAG TPA: flavin reductase family protein [Xanthobacteraceae bacterium]|nr:flavin reductase family protein [Xanthobacteraceae bacterium]